MKTKVVSITYLLPLLFITLFLLPSQALAQCANVVVNVVAHDSPCSFNGKIEVNVTGTDIDNGKYTNLEYRAYLTNGGTPGEWQSDNVLSGFGAGTYTVDIQGVCSESGGYIAILKAKTGIVIAEQPWQTVKFGVSVRRQALEDLPSGQVVFAGAEGGQGPYKLEMTGSPASYTGVKVKTFTNLSEITGFVWDNLPAGTYEFSLSENPTSMCKSVAKWTINVEALLLADMPYGTFYQFHPYQQYDNTKTDSECNKSLAASWGYFIEDPKTPYYTPFYYYFVNASQYLEYTVAYIEDGNTPNPSAYTWQALTNFAVYGGYFPLANLKYTIDEMRADTNKRPRVFVRLKGDSNKTKLFSSPSFLGVNPYVRVTPKGDCGNSDVIFYLYSNYYGVHSWPVTWKIEKMNGSTVESLVAEQTQPLSWEDVSKGRTGYKYTGELSQGNYRATIKTVTGAEHQKDIKVSGGPLETRVAAYVSNVCLGSEVPYVIVNYASGETDYTLKDIKEVAFIKAEKSLDGGVSYTPVADNDPDFVKPTLKVWKREDVTNIYNLNNSRYVTLWGKDADKAIQINPNTPSEQRLMDGVNLSQVGKNVMYKYHYKVTDNCGNTKDYAGVSQSYYYDYVETPNFVTTYDCFNGFKLTVPNSQKLIKYKYRADRYTPSSTSSYIRIVDGPAGGYDPAEVIASYDLQKASVNIKKAGTYKVQVWWYSNSNNNMGSDYLQNPCAKYYDVTVAEVGDLTLDLKETSAFRCPGGTVGDGGYINVKLKNGSGGPYEYKLYQIENGTGQYHLLGTNNTGLFNGWTSAIQSDSYTLKVSDVGCSGSVREFEQSITVSNLDRVPIAWTDNQGIGGNVYNVCNGETIKLRAMALGTDSYLWTFSGDPSWSSTDKDVDIPAAHAGVAGTYTVKITIPHCGGLVMTADVVISVGAPTLYWNPAAQNTNWFDPNNWLFDNGAVSGGYPSMCTEVHIPGNADNYPNLDKGASPWAGGKPICDTIVYHYGGETLYPTHLTYSGAKIQYNYGYYGSSASFINGQPDEDHDQTYPGNNLRPVTRMQSGRWYMLSGPLKQMHPVDFNLGGYPSTYQRHYNITNPGTGKNDGSTYTRPYETYDYTLSQTNNALSVAVSPYNANQTGANDHRHLHALRGVLEIPYIHNPQIKTQRPLHTYNPGTKTSTINYYDMETLAPIAGQEKTITRDNQAYRFIFEQADNKPATILEGANEIPIYKMALTLPQGGSKIMIGNPLMSHIDFDKLHQNNNGTIKDHYEIIDAQTGTTLAYKKGAGPSQALTKDIAPLQAIIVELINPSTPGQELTFHLEGNNTVIATSGTTIKPRNYTEPTPSSWIRLTTLTKDSTGADHQKDVSRLLFGMPNTNDMPKAIQNQTLDQKAEIFLIDQTNTWHSDLNKKTSTTPVTYQIGILSTHTGIITLNINPGGNQLTNVKLVDTHLNTTIDMTNGGNYTFRHRHDWFTGGRIGMDLTRFQLIITHKK